jgi:hypothetical protein
MINERRPKEDMKRPKRLEILQKTPNFCAPQKYPEIYRVFSKLRRSLYHEVLYIILKNFSLNLLSKMFVLTEIIDCIFFMVF